MSEPRFEAHMNDADAVLWTIERDPVLRTTIGAVGLLDGSPDDGRLRVRLERLVQEVPRLHQRAVSPPLRLGPPRWVDVPGFDEVLAITAEAVGADFDPAQPLWELVVLDGLDGGRAAFVLKLHHSVTDGMGALRLAGSLFDLERSPAAVDAPVPAAAVGGSGTLALAGAALVDDVLLAEGLVAGTARRMPGVLAHVVRHPLGSATEAARVARSVAMLLAPVHAPLSPLMTRRGLERSVRVFDVPFTDIHEAGRRIGCSVNDAFLAAVTGGLRRYHDRHGAPVDALRVTMPVDLRDDGDSSGGNRFAPARFPVPVAVADPQERMRRISALTKAWRAEPALPLTDALAFALNRMPTPATTRLFGAMLKAIDFVATDLPGLDVPVYLAGARVDRLYALAPPSGAACNVALLSHCGTCCIGVNVDTAAVPDPDALVEDLRAGFDEVVAAGRPARRRSPRRVS
jgi:diacylglycerol O-acyltransferase